jgi:hypothetical protein
MWKRTRKILKAFLAIILMARYYWIIFGLIILAALIQLAGFRSLELTIVLFSLNFMVLAVELVKPNLGKGGIMAKMEKLEMVLNDISSNLISPTLRKKGQEIIEWLNKF